MFDLAGAMGGFVRLELSRLCHQKGIEVGENDAITDEMSAIQSRLGPEAPQRMEF